MKKLLHTIGLLILSISGNVFAQTNKQQQSRAALDELLGSGSYLKSKVAAKLPEGDVLADVVPTVLDWSLRISWVAMILVIAYTSLQMVVSRGEEETLNKAKRNLVNALLAFIVISGALALVTGIVSFKF